METGTLKELNVQPGDVVECVREGSGYTKEGWRYVINDDRGVDGLGQIFFTKSKFRIISRATPQPDLTAITTPFGLLDTATQEALRAHGGPYEMWFGEKWSDIKPDWSAGVPTYRVKPAPKVETVTVDGWLTPGGSYRQEPNPMSTPVRVTFNRIDGVIDLASYRVEAR